MKSDDGKKAWEALVLLGRTLNETPLDQLQWELETMLDIDSTLRFLALDVALVNSDGYWTRASDYNLFLHCQYRLSFRLPAAAHSLAIRRVSSARKLGTS